MKKKNNDCPLCKSHLSKKGKKEVRKELNKLLNKNPKIIWKIYQKAIKKK